MMEIDYSRLSTDELIRRFTDGVLVVGGGYGYGIYGKLEPKSPEAQALKRDIRAAAEELRSRKPFAALRQLYDHANPNVRSWADAQFGSIDPEWSSAGAAGIGENLNATEVMALRARVQKPPPAHPTLREMSTEQLVERFEDAGIRAYATRFFYDKTGWPDIEKRNRVIGEILDIVAELKTRGALAALLPYLDHPLITLRHEAAVHCLPIATERAISVLESVIAKKEFGESSSASRTLDRWRRGTYGTSAY